MFGQEYEHGVALRLLEGLEQRVLRLIVHPIRFLDDEDLVRTLEGRTGRFGDHGLADNADRDQRAFGDDVMDVGMVMSEDPQTLSTFAAPFARRDLAVESRGHRHRGGGLAGPRRAEQEPRMCDLVAGHLRAQSSRGLRSLDSIPDAHRGIGGPGGAKSRAKVVSG